MNHAVMNYNINIRYFYYLLMCSRRIRIFFIYFLPIAAAAVLIIKWQVYIYVPIYYYGIKKTRWSAKKKKETDGKREINTRGNPVNNVINIIRCACQVTGHRTTIIEVYINIIVNIYTYICIKYI